MKEFPFIKFALFFVIGILLENFFQPELIPLLFITITLFLFAFSLRKISSKALVDVIRTSIFYISFILIGLVFAVFNNSEVNSKLLKYQKEKNSILYAEVTNIELQKSYEIVFTVFSDSIIIGGKSIVTQDNLICKFRGDSLQRNNLYSILKPGNKVYLTGTFQKGREERNPNEFDYDKYLKSKGIVGLFVSYQSDSISICNDEINIIQAFLFNIRKNIDKAIDNYHQPQTAALLRGLLLADRSEIDFETKNDFINSGVIHTLAVSGLHVGYILIISIFIFGRFGIYSRTFLMILALLCFMFLTGVPPSVFRATLMAIIILITFLLNRSTNIINSISIAAVIILLINTNEIYNPGFQLSFAAVLSIGLLFPHIQKIIHNLKLKHKWLEYILLFIGVSLSAQIGTMPFTLVYFSKLSLVALFSNLLVIPTIGIIIGNAFITLFVGIFSETLASIFASANDLFTWLMFNFIRITGRLEFSFLWIRDYTLYDSIIFYFVLTFILFAFNKIQKVWIKFTVVSLSILIILLYSQFDNKEFFEKNKLSILMIDVGQGDSFLIKFPNGKTALIDAGEANPFIDNGKE